MAIKGNIIVGQSGGPTAVINSSLAGVIEAAKDAGVKKIYGMHNGIEGLLKEDIIDLNDHIKDAQDLALLRRTPSAFLGSCRYKLPVIEGNEEVYEKLFAILEKYNIQYLLYNGGNDSMDTVKMLSDYASLHNKPQKFMGIPKTIDNDLPMTDHCPGFGSAAKYIAASMKEIIRDNAVYGETRTNICIVEIMGRHAGWLTAAAALSKGPDCCGPDMIYLPEAPFDPEDFMKRVKELAKTKKSIVIAVSEGVKLADGRFVCELSGGSDKLDAFGHKQLSGVGTYLAQRITAETEFKARSIEFSTLQRCAAHLTSLTDADEAYGVGYLAAQKAFEGCTGMMVTIQVTSRKPYIVEYSQFDIHEIANVERKIPQKWIINDGTYVSDEFVKYARPLIIGELQPHFAGGVPVHITLE
ncbi:MAG: 6-phosphofructokinase [Mogibacterium sp.]|nr:6-phosphofructokinase [Mogibacterium sp.]MBR2539908.1 6-phosphofructokinase [Mogibacterium sp.]